MVGARADFSVCLFRGGRGTRADFSVCLFRGWRGKFFFLFYFSFLYIGAGVFNKTANPIALVGHENIIVNLAQSASLACYHLISNARSWTNC